MNKIIALNNYPAFGIICSIDNPLGLKLELRYYYSYQGTISEIKDYCKETAMIEKQARKYINSIKDKEFILWSY